MSGFGEREVVHDANGNRKEIPFPYTALMISKEVLTPGHMESYETMTKYNFFHVEHQAIYTVTYVSGGDTTGNLPLDWIMVEGK